jgi:hypothetical protein
MSDLWNGRNNHSLVSLVAYVDVSQLAVLVQRALDEAKR